MATSSPATGPRPFRFIDWLADPTPGAGAASLRAFRTLLLVHATIRVWDRAANEAEVLFFGGEAALLALAAAATLAAGWSRAGVLVAAWVLSVELVITPSVANHVYLEWLGVALFAFLDPDDPEEAGLLLCSLRWITLILFFYTGVQKLLHGAFFRGELLAWMIAQRPPFAEFFGWILPNAEMARLTALDGVTPGTGPYRASSPLLLLLTNLVWIAEISLPFAMALQRTRVFATVAAAGFVLAFQLGARETMFALLFTQLCLLLLPADGYRRLAPLFVCAYAYLAAFLLGWVPGSFLVKLGGL